MATLDTLKALGEQNAARRGVNQNAPVIPNTIAKLQLKAPVFKKVSSGGGSRGVSKADQEHIRRMAMFTTAVPKSGDITRTSFASKAPASYVAPMAKATPQNFWQKAGEIAASPFKAGLSALGTVFNYASAALTGVGAAAVNPLSAALFKLTPEGKNVSYGEALKLTNAGNKDLITGITQGKTLAEQSGFRDWAQNKLVPQVGMDESGIRKFTRGVVGMAADFALDPTTYLGGASLEKLVGKAGEASLSRAGVRAYKQRVAEVIDDALNKAGKNLTIEQKLKIQQGVVEEFVKDAKKLPNDSRFSKGGVRVLGTDYVIPGTPQLSNAMKSMYGIGKQLIQHTPGMAGARAMITDLMSHFKGDAQLIGQVDKYTGQEADRILSEVNGSKQVIQSDIEKLTGRTQTERNAFLDKQYTDHQQLLDELQATNASEVKPVGKLTDAEEAIIQATRGDKTLFNQLRPWAQSVATRIYGLVDDTARAEQRVGVDKAIFKEANYVPQQVGGKYSDDIAKEAGTKAAAISQKIADGTATAAEKQAYLDLQAILQGQFQDTPWFHMPRTFSDLASMRAAGYTPRTLTDVVIRRLQGSNEFVGQRELVQRVFDKYGKVVGKDVAPDEAARLIRQEGEKLGEDGLKTTQVYDAAEGKMYEIPSDLKAVMDRVGNSMGGDASIAFNHPVLKKTIKAMDWFTSVYKTAVTGFFPAFFTRNFVSQIFNNIMAQGVWMTMKPSALGDIWMLTKPVLNDAERAIKRNYGGVEYTMGELYDFIKKQNVTQTRGKNEFPVWFSNFFTAAEDTAGKAVGLKTSNLPHLAERSETVPRVASFLQSLDGHGNLYGAAAASRKINYDYSRLSPLERDVMKKAVPFYAYRRQNIAFHLSNIRENPKVYANIGRAYSALQNEAYKHDESMRTAYLDNYVKNGFFLPVPTGKDDQGRYTFLNELGLSFEDFNRSTQLFTKEGILQNLASLNPALKYFIEAPSGASLFTADKVTPDDARSQMLLLKALDKIMPDFVQYSESVEPKTGKKVYTANPQAIILASNLPSSRAVQLASSYFRQDKTTGDNLLKTFTGLSTQKINPDISLYFNNVEQAKAMRELYVNMGIVKQQNNGRYTINYNRILNNNLAETQNQRYQASLVLRYLENTRTNSFPGK